MTRIGSLFSGAGGLDRAAEQVFDGHTVWHCEVDPAASKVLAHRWPGVPNLGDITAVDWAQVEPVDVLCGGFPCQDVSAAGRRAGIKDDTRSGLWAVFADAIAALRPPMVVVENVRGLLNAQAHRPMESDPDALGDGEAQPVLRAIGAVLGDLADLGYDAQWATISAASVGAPHKRERVFILATATHTHINGSHGERSEVGIVGRGTETWGDCVDASDTPRDGRHEGRPESAGFVGGSDAALSSDGPLLPTPAVNDIGEGKTVEWWDEWCAKSKAKHGNGNGHGNSLAIEAQRISGDGPVELLPTPQAHDAQGPKTQLQIDSMRAKGTGVRNLNETAIHELLSTPQARDHKGVPADGFNTWNLCRDVADVAQWGKYEPAIRRWENLTRPAPAPTEPNKNGNPRLSAAFSEWMLGWPAGWVTKVPGISRNDQLRIIGNGVAPQQAEAAIRWLLSVSEVAA